MRTARIAERVKLGRWVSTLTALCVLFGVRGAISLQAESKANRGKAKHVVLIVWDGMRPEFITKENAPTLWRLARDGVTFRHHHSVYPTLTSVNATALATGVHPGRSGPIGNYEYRPEIDPTKTVRMDSPVTIRRGDEVTGGKYLAVPTIAELVQSSGGRAAVAGTKPAPLLFNRKPAARSITVYGGVALPTSVQSSLEKLLGPYPTTTELPSVAEDRWTTRALAELLWSERVPELSVLWMGDPDRSQHATGPGSEMSLAAIKSADGNLDLLVRALEKKRARDETDMLIVSDHGFSTIGRSIDVADRLQKEGFSVRSTSETALQKGEVRVVGNGGTNFFYVGDRDAGVTARLVEWLQQSDFAGVIFSRAGHEGTFPLEQVHVDTAAGPDVVMAFRWNDGPNEHGVAGTIDANGKGEGAKGTHGTLSPFDVHNILIAVGPDFRRNVTSDLPSSNMDIAPSILHLLGIAPANSLDGRILTEAMVDGGAPPAAAEANMIEAYRSGPTGTWRQYLRTTKVRASVYIDEGNGAFSSK